MATTILDYIFNATSVANPDGTFPIHFPSANYLSGGGPGPVLVNLDYVDAINLKGASSFVTLDGVDGLAAWDRFRIRIVFQCPATFDGDQVLFSIGEGPSATLRILGKNGLLHLSGDARDSFLHSWATSTEKTPDLNPGSWYVADLIYDNDTLFVLLDEHVIGIHGFGQVARLYRNTGQPVEVGIGGGIFSAGSNFNGLIAAFGLEVGGVRPDLENLTDNARLTAEWYITTKIASLLLGGGISPSSPVVFDHRTFAWSQDYGDRIIMYHSNASSAYTISGEVLKFYRAVMTEDERSILGHLMSDQIGDAGGNESATFSNGVIYKPANGPTTFISGQLYLDYEISGGRRKWGFPTQQAHQIHGGTSQEMQNGTFFLRDKRFSAHAVKGDILANYNPDAWGFPIVDEKDVFVNGVSSGSDKMSEFEFCTVYSTPSAGTHAIMDPIRQLYDSMGGPTVLGFPKIDQVQVGELASTKVQMFNDNIIWTDGTQKTVIIRPFSLFLQQIDTTSQGASDNKLYVKTLVHYITGATGAKELLLQDKLPHNSEHWGSRNSVPGINTAVSPKIVIKDIADSVVIWIEAWDADSPDPDDEIGEYELTLDASNGWGYNSPTLKFNSGPSPSNVTNIMVELKPASSSNIPDERKKFWTLPNIATQPLTESDFSHAFLDVSDADSVQPLEETREAFYEHAVRDIAVTGNCFGMCLEAISARKFISHFDFILSKYTNPSEVIQDWNLKQQYQAGAASWWWWVDQVISPRLLSSVNVFLRSREENQRGCRPLLTFFDTHLEDNNGHCVFPLQWREVAGSNLLQIDVLDPMTGVTPRVQTVKIDTTTDTFEYQNWNSAAGSKMHYIPWGLVNREPRTGTWEQMLCTFDGTVIAMSGDVHTKNITDRGGFDLSATGARATNSLDTGRRLDGHFARLPVYMSGKFPGEILLSRGVAPIPKGDLAGLPPGADPVDLPLQLADVSQPLFPLQRLESLQTTRAGDFHHTIVGRKETGNDRLQYFAKSNLCHMSIDCSLISEEEMQIHSNAIGTTTAEYAIDNTHGKRMTVQLLHRLGFTETGWKNDFTLVTIELQWVKPGRLRMAVKPGLVRVELFPSTAGILDRATIKVVSVLDGVRRQRDLSLTNEYINGVRLKINPALLTEEIIVAKLGAGGDIVKSEAHF